MKWQTETTDECLKKIVKMNRTILEIHENLKKMDGIAAISKAKKNAKEMFKQAREKAATKVNK